MFVRCNPSAKLAELVQSKYRHYTEKVADSFLCIIVHSRQGREMLHLFLIAFLIINSGELIKIHGLT